ncbi:MAG: hypothetical protein AAGL89_18240 [Pseudomonadota bacterium]
MTRTRTSTTIYWILAALCGWGVIVAVQGTFHDLYPTPWRYPVWWSVLLITHLARLPAIILIWAAFYIDLFEPLMLMLYGTQSGALIILGWPFVVLGLLIYLWRKGEYRWPMHRNAA